jgi:hypothetical protein
MTESVRHSALGDTRSLNRTNQSGDLRSTCDKHCDVCSRRSTNRQPASPPWSGNYIRAQYTLRSRSNPGDRSASDTLQDCRHFRLETAIARGGVGPTRTPLYGEIFVQRGAPSVLSIFFVPQSFIVRPAKLDSSPRPPSRVGRRAQDLRELFCLNLRKTSP